MSRKFTDNEFKNMINDTNPNIKIIGVYTCIRNKIDCECLVCGYKWSPVASELKRVMDVQNVQRQKDIKRTSNLLVR